MNHAIKIVLAVSIASWQMACCSTHSVQHAATLRVTIHITGFVRHPGVFSVQRDIGVSGALSKAGGATRSDAYLVTISRTSKSGEIRWRLVSKDLSDAQWERFVFQDGDKLRVETLWL